jgi:hypothetical protein
MQITKKLLGPDVKSTGKAAILREGRGREFLPDEHFRAALALHGYLIANHCERSAALLGPDVGIRFNFRLGRFIKSAFSFLPWQDSYYYLQAQAYWVLANWSLFKLTGEPKYRQLACSCSEQMIQTQRSDGAWDYPNPEWKGRIATAECTWATLGLLETYRNTADPSVLSSILQWHNFLISRVGFEKINDELSINYFAGRRRSRIPNNSAFVLRFLAELADVTGDSRYLDLCKGLLTFMKRAQKTTGEFPYMVRGNVVGGRCWEHFQCYQYNAFQCLDLLQYYHRTYDENVKEPISNCLNFLSGGLATDGRAFYDCKRGNRYVLYHSAAIGAAFAMARHGGFGGYDTLRERAFSYLVQKQAANGFFPYSFGDYSILGDRRSYPRALSMILFHLLENVRAQETRGTQRSVIVVGPERD